MIFSYAFKHTHLQKSSCVACVKTKSAIMHLTVVVVVIFWFIVHALKTNAKPAETERNTVYKEPLPHDVCQR
jgi:hypothetical protein